VSDEAWERRLAALKTEARGDAVVHLARSFGERRRGLAGMTPLPVGHALHLPRCRSVHTFGMRFALDLVWLDKRGAVVRVDHDVAPQRMRTCVRARSVVETAAGAGDELARAYA
jgi:uncharacterized membrane protein (UPF0127 family)